MLKFIAGIVIGIVVATVGVDGVADLAREGVATIQDAARGASDAVANRSAK